MDFPTRTSKDFARFNNSVNTEIVSVDMMRFVIRGVAGMDAFGEDDAPTRL